MQREEGRKREREEEAGDWGKRNARGSRITRPTA